MKDRANLNPVNFGHLSTDYRLKGNNSFDVTVSREIVVSKFVFSTELIEGTV